MAPKVFCKGSNGRFCEGLIEFFYWPVKIYKCKETKAAIVVAQAIPTCPKGLIKITAHIKLVNRTVAEYFTGVLVSPRAKKFGARALTKT